MSKDEMNKDDEYQALAAQLTLVINCMVGAGEQLVLMKKHETPERFQCALEALDFEPAAAEIFMEIALAPAEQQRALALKALEDDAVWRTITRHARRVHLNPAPTIH